MHIHAPPRTATPIRQPDPPHHRPVPAPSVDASPQGNRLLAALPDADLQRWSRHLELVEMSFGQLLCESGHSFDHVHFPTSSIVSLLNLTADGDSAEVATVGNDGVVGVPLLMGSLSTSGRAVVQSPGQAYRLKSQVVIDEFNRGGEVMRLLLRYVQALVTQVAQTAVCNRHHSIDQQVCRLLLLSLDRVEGSCLQMTHELLAGKVGVRRESVTASAVALQRAGLIRYARGHIEVLDRAGLEDRTCECYGVVKLECDRLLPLAARGACLEPVAA
jgi:CRP-like cAMP-binding protein